MAADWQVVRVTGLVWVVAADMEPLRAAAGMVLPDNATVATTSQARAMLRHGEDVLSVGPLTQVAPQSRQIRGLTTVLMRTGEVEFNIEHLSAPHFAVQTPFLAAVVKGTQFTVAVSGGSSAVSVETGRVRVSALAAGQAFDLTNGQTAKLADGELQFSGPGSSPSIQNVAPQESVVEAAADGASGKNGNANASSSAGGNGNSGSSNAGGNSGNSNAGGNSGNSNAGGNSGNSNAGGNSGNSNAGGNGNGNGDSS
jgi:hypothetical protein